MSLFSKRRPKKWIALGLLASVFPCGVSGQNALPPAASGDDIAREAERVNQGFGSENSRLSLVLISANGGRTERELTLQILENLEEGNRSRIDVEAPANARGTVLLTHSNRNGDDDQWLYLPAARRVRRVTAGNRTGSFMGSEFTYEDLIPPLVERFEYERRADADVDGTLCYVVERRPLDGDSGYSRQVIWLDKTHLVPLRVEYYDRRDELLKAATYSDYEDFDGFRRPGVVLIENVQTRRASEMVSISRIIGLDLDENRFRSASLAP